MSTPFLGQINIFSFEFAPKGWAMANGQLLPINQNQALFSLLGTYYGGDGRTTFALPNLQSRVAMHQGNGHVQGEVGGTEAVSLTTSEIPLHSHAVKCNGNAADQASPSGMFWAADGAGNLPYSTSGGSAMAGGAIGVQTPAGGSQPHNNVAPILVLSFCIALSGIFPSRN
jgi:microcystin-dependent protein